MTKSGRFPMISDAWITPETVLITVVPSELQGPELAAATVVEIGSGNGLLPS